MSVDSLKELENEITNLEKQRINNAEWADLTLSELELIDDLEKRREYRKKMNEYHMQIINTFSTLVSSDFKFSTTTDKLTYRIMATDYMNYFYAKGMTREEIVKMMVDSKITQNSGKKQK